MIISTLILLIVLISTLFEHAADRKPHVVSYEKYKPNAKNSFIDPSPSGERVILEKGKIVEIYIYTTTGEIFLWKALLRNEFAILIKKEGYDAFYNMKLGDGISGHVTTTYRVTDNKEQFLVNENINSNTLKNNVADILSQGKLVAIKVVHTFSYHDPTDDY